MKTISKFLLVLMLAVPFVGFTGCDDDDDDGNDGTVDSVVGNYKGSLKLWNTLSVADNVIIEMKKKDDTHVTFPIDLEFTVSLGTSAGPAVKVKGDCENIIGYASGKYTIDSATGNNFTVTITEPGGDPQIIPNMSVAIKGTIEGKNENLEITVPLPAELLAAFAGNDLLAGLIGQLQPDQYGNVPVTVNFSGTKQ